MPPSTRSSSTPAPTLNAGIEALIVAKDNPKLAPAKVILESIVRILVIARDGMIEDQAFVQLAQRCFRMCHVLETMTKESDFSGLSEPLGKALGDLERTIYRVESKIFGRIPGAYNSQERRSGTGEVAPALWEAELQKALEIINEYLEFQDTFVDGGNENRPQLPNQSTEMITQSGGDSRSAPAKPSDSAEKALQSLISGTIPHDQLSSLVEIAFSSENAIKTVGCLQESDAQAFIDVVDKALESTDMGPNVRTKCLKPLYKACASHGLLPRSLQIDLVDGLTGDALYRGGFGDVRKCEHQGQQVAVKVLRMYASDDIRKTTRRFCKEFIAWKALQHPNVLPLLGVVMSGTQFAMVSEWMPYGNINEFLTARWDVNRFGLLEDVAEGLAYMHEQEMVHGDLKGANIVIDKNYRACLADFGLLRIISETTNLAPSSSSFTQGGTYRWMSPELLLPEKFGLPHCRPTKASDCYALGMVFYEVLSGNMPFHTYDGHLVVSLRVLGGKRPDRPHGTEGLWVTDDVWGVLEQCWKARPGERPSVARVLQCLKGWTPPSETLSSAGLSSRRSDPSTGGSVDEGQTPSPLRVALSQSWRALLSQVLRYEASDGRDPRADGNDRSGSDPEKPAETQYRAPSTGSSIRGSSIRQRVPHRYHEGSLQPNLTTGRGTSAEAQALEPRNSVTSRGSIENALSGVAVTSKGGQYPSASRPVGTFVQITCTWVTSQRPLIAFFFF